MPFLPRRIPIPRNLLTSSRSSCIGPLRTHLSRTPFTATSFQLRQSRAASDNAQEHGHEEHGHESPYDEPGGWLFGIRPGEKYEKEGWENLMIYGWFGGIIVAVVVYAGKEDTTIQTWALEEARRRLEKEGILEDPYPDQPILEEPKK